MTGFILQLSGPLQSWGTNSAWHHRDSHIHPTRSGITGILAAALGVARGEPLTRFDGLAYTVRVDRCGKLVTDYHTVGGGRAPKETPVLAGGGHRPAGKGTIVTERRYLTDAAFTVAVTGGDPAFLDELAHQLARPVYATYLGRRSCPPPAYLHLGSWTDPVAALHADIPLNRRKPRDDGPEVDVDFVTETRPDASTRIMNTPTWPDRFGHHRRYRRHTTAITTYRLPATLCGGFGIDYLTRLASIVRVSGEEQP